MYTASMVHEEEDGLHRLEFSFRNLKIPEDPKRKFMMDLGNKYE